MPLPFAIPALAGIFSAGRIALATLGTAKVADWFDDDAPKPAINVTALAAVGAAAAVAVMVLRKPAARAGSRSFRRGRR